MSARKKLNTAFVNGSLLIAGLAGLATGSWVVFGTAFAASVALSCYAGNIRPARTGKQAFGRQEHMKGGTNAGDRKVRSANGVTAATAQVLVVASTASWSVLHGHSASERASAWRTDARKQRRTWRFWSSVSVEEPDDRTPHCRARGNERTVAGLAMIGFCRPPVISLTRRPA
jgi:hypothetical protein